MRGGVGIKRGLLALTDRRVIWVSHGTASPVVRELPYGDVLDVKLSRVPEPRSSPALSRSARPRSRRSRPKERAAGDRRGRAAARRAAPAQ